MTIAAQHSGLASAAAVLSVAAINDAGPATVMLPMTGTKLALLPFGTFMPSLVSPESSPAKSTPPDAVAGHMTGLDQARQVAGKSGEHLVVPLTIVIEPIARGRSTKWVSIGAKTPAAKHDAPDAAAAVPPLVVLPLQSVSIPSSQILSPPSSAPLPLSVPASPSHPLLSSPTSLNEIKPLQSFRSSTSPFPLSTVAVVSDATIVRAVDGEATITAVQETLSVARLPTADRMQTTTPTLELPALPLTDVPFAAVPWAPSLLSVASTTRLSAEWSAVSGSGGLSVPMDTGSQGPANIVKAASGSQAEPPGQGVAALLAPPILPLLPPSPIKQPAGSIELATPARAPQRATFSIPPNVAPEALPGDPLLTQIAVQPGQLAASNARPAFGRQDGKPTQAPAADTRPGVVAVDTASLGAVSAEVTRRTPNGQAALHVKFAVERTTTASLIANHSDGLDRALAIAGVRLDAISIEVRGDRFTPTANAMSGSEPGPRGGNAQHKASQPPQPPRQFRARLADLPPSADRFA